MRFIQTLLQQRHLYFKKSIALVAAIFLMTSACAAQAAAPAQPGLAWYQELQNDPALRAELDQLLMKLKHGVQFPLPRGQSRLLPLQQESTVLYTAIPNYGDASHQALTIFQQELKDSPVLRAWWQRGDLAAIGPKAEDALEKFYQLSQFLGDEIAVSVGTEGRQGPSLQILAEVKKPGLKDFLQQMAKHLADGPKPPFRVFNVQELAAAKDMLPPQEPMILVRPDLVLATLDLGELKRLNAHLDGSSQEFAASPFGQRVAQAYEGGTTVVGAIDLQRVLKQVPRGTDENQVAFQRTGFADLKYLVWEHKNVAGEAASQMELSFAGPRHGVAAWLGAPGPLGSLDFVSPAAILAATVRLNNPPQIFDDVEALANASNPKASAPVTQMETTLKLSLKEDLLRYLGGEITLEVDSFKPPEEPTWRAIFQVNDPANGSDRLQATLTKLLALAPVKAQESAEEGITYHTLQIPSAQKTREIGYAFADGYLIIGSSHETITEAVRLHRSGESLAHSTKFLAALPPGQGSEASGLLFENPAAFAALTMRQAMPELVETFSQAAADSPPMVVCAYGDETAIREVSRSGGFDAGVVLAGAAIAIPNLLRARMASNEASAVATIRTANTAQIVYRSAYPERGFAHDLATLGPGPGAAGIPSADHAGLIDATLGNAGCTAGTWCTKSGFQFSIKAVCKKQICEQFVVVATPVSSSTGARNFCSTSDAVIRGKFGAPLSTPVSVSECQKWTPLQ
jgi:hypothetical protein